MAAVAIDTYAATNPAFCCTLIISYLEGYAQPMPLPLILLPVPVLLTNEIADSFDGTNSTTGLITWTTRHPEITVGMRDRLRKTAEYSRQGLLFGVRYNALTVDSKAQIFLRQQGLKKKLPTAGDSFVAKSLKLAKRFGIWVGAVGNTETVLLMLGANK